MSPALNIFIPLQKVDMAKRQVWGVAAIEQPDRAIPPEIMDYAKSKPHFLEWSATMQKASKGLSLGNVRAMHGGQLMAVGRVIHLEPRDPEKSIYVGVELVDDAAWEKVTKGVYTGFSIGGSYGEHWPDTLLKGHMRYEAIPNELSLADMPCIPGATFEVIKADGASELRKFEKAFPPAKDKKPADAATTDAAAADAAANDAAASDAGTTDQTPPNENQPAQAADNATSDQPPATSQQTPESAPSGAEGQEPADGQENPAQRESLDEEAVKGILISLLMELGLVQQSGAQPMSMAMRMDDLSKAVTGQKSQVESVVGELQKTVDGQRSTVEELRKTVSADIAQVVMAVQTLEKRGGSGPVIRDLGAISPQAMADMQKASVLKDLVKDTEDPLTRQKLQEEITRLEIKAVQSNKPQ